MSLYFHLRITPTGQSLGLMAIRRIDNPDLVKKISTYAVSIDSETVGIVRHRYSDGAWVLLHKATGHILSIKESKTSTRVMRATVPYER